MGEFATQKLVDKTCNFCFLIFFGQRGALRNIARLAGDEQMRDLRIVEAGEDTAKQCAIGLWQTQRQAAPSNGFLGEPLLVSIA